jgi:plastocyanin
VSFLNPGTGTLHEHQDYDFRILKDGQVIFSAARQTGQAVLHNVEGTLTVPYTFQENGDYTVQMHLAGTGISPTIPTDEEATFSVTVMPEFQQQEEQQQVQQQNQGVSISIVPGSSTLTDTAFQPNPVQVSVGDTVTWTNNDSQPHTVTSGSNGVPDNKFNSSPNFNPLIALGATFSHTFTEPGELVEIDRH